MGSRRALIAASLGLLLIWAVWPRLPQPLFQAPLSSALYDRQGQLLGARIATDGQWRFAASGEALPDKLAQALVLREDRRFHQHLGIDPLALLRALRQNWRAGHIVSGGSTLTMQLVRLARGNPPRTLGEKIREALLALRLEWRYSKAEILALYAAHAPFGGNVVGAEAAAWRYFGHAPQQLSWAEAATLAVLPNSPGLIHPGRGRERLRARRDGLLQRLHERGQLDALTYRLALAEPLPGAPLSLPRLAPHLLDTLTARHGPLRESVTLSRRLQEAVSRRLDAATERLAAQGVHNAAVLVVDHRDMTVLAYAGNRSLAPEPGRGFAVDLIQRPRSTGSLLKPFLFAAMVQDGALAPSSLVPDIPTHFSGFQPENFDRQYRGAVHAKDALAQSLNVPAVYLLREYGVAHFYDQLRQLGMSTLFRMPDGYGLTLVLGGAEGTLWELTQMYANLARIAASGHSRASATQGRLRVRADEPPQSVSAAPFGAGAAWLTLEALQEVSRPELDHNWKNFVSARRLAWKTGTSFGLRDGWAIGITAQHVIGVWVGNAGGEGQAGLTGAGMAAPLLFEILGELPDGLWLTQPVQDLAPARLCRDDGYLPAAGCETEMQLLPAGGRFQRVSPHHLNIHLDAQGRWRLHSRCASINEMRAHSWFVLPPVQEYFYRRQDLGYRPLPRYRPDCQRMLDDEGGAAAFDLVYPQPGARLYIPVELGGKPGRVILEAVHRRSDAKLHWHLDETYLATTGPFHQLALDLAPGPHRLTLVDEAGERLTRSFTVLSKQEE